MHKKTVFSITDEHYHFNLMPFGLKSAHATFQRFMDQVLLGLQRNDMFVYLDNIVIYTSSLAEHQTK